MVGRSIIEKKKITLLLKLRFLRRMLEQQLRCKQLSEI